MDEKEIILEIYRYSSSKFYDDCMRFLTKIPFEKEIFVETVTSGYQLILERAELTIPKIKTLVSRNVKTCFSEQEIEDEVGKIARGEVVDKRLLWQWANYCWMYIKILRTEEWNYFCFNVSQRDRVMTARQSKIFHDFIYLLLTIEYLSING